MKSLVSLFRRSPLHVEVHYI